MKQTIEIDVPAGKKAVWEDGTLKFIDDKPSMPKTWEEFCKVHPLQPTDTIINSNCVLFPCYFRLGMQRRKDEDRNYLPTREAAEAHLALMQLHQLRDYYRQGWRPIEDERKYAIIRSRNEYDHFLIDVVPAPRFLTFPTRWLATEFLTNFRDLIEQAGDLI